MCDPTRWSLCPSPWKYIKVWEYSDPFFQNLKPRSETPRWPLTPHLLRSHVWLYPRIIVSKSHGNTSMYVDTVINFAKLYPRLPHTTYYIRTMSDHIVSFWTKFRRDKKPIILESCLQVSHRYKRLLRSIKGHYTIGSRLISRTWKKHL